MNEKVEQVTSITDLDGQTYMVYMANITSLLLGRTYRQIYLDRFTYTHD